MMLERKLRCICWVISFYILKAAAQIVFLSKVVFAQNLYRILIVYEYNELCSTNLHRIYTEYSFCHHKEVRDMLP